MRGGIRDKIKAKRRFADLRLMWKMGVKVKIPQDEGVIIISKPKRRGRTWKGKWKRERIKSGKARQRQMAEAINREWAGQVRLVAFSRSVRADGIGSAEANKTVQWAGNSGLARWALVGWGDSLCAVGTRTGSVLPRAQATRTEGW
jgi:hypothetical protein